MSETELGGHFSRAVAAIDEAAGNRARAEEKEQMARSEATRCANAENKAIHALADAISKLPEKIQYELMSIMIKRRAGKQPRRGEEAR